MTVGCIACPDICAFCGEPIREQQGWFMIQGALSDRVILLHRGACCEDWLWTLVMACRMESQRDG